MRVWFFVLYDRTSFQNENRYSKYKKKKNEKETK